MAIVTNKPVFHHVHNERMDIVAQPIIPAGTPITVGEKSKGAAEDDGSWVLSKVEYEHLQANGTLVDEDEQAKQVEAQQVAAAQAVIAALPEHIRAKVSTLPGDDRERVAELEAQLADAHKSAEAAADLARENAELQAKLTANEAASEQAKQQSQQRR